MNIKKIIKEEIDDWGWADEIVPHQPYIGMRFLGSSYNADLASTVTNVDTHMVTFRDDGGDTKRRPYKDFIRRMDKGIFRVVKDLKESDDLDWIRDIKAGNPIEIGSLVTDGNIEQAYVGDRVVASFNNIIFTIEEVRKNDGWVWGHELDLDRDRPYKNYHNPLYLQLHKPGIKESNDFGDFGWASEIPAQSDLSVGELIYKYGVNSDSKPFLIEQLVDSFDEIEYKDGKVVLELGGDCELVDLFVDNDSSQYNYVTKWLAEKVLCEDDHEWWEPYSDVIYDWEEQVWSIVEGSPKAMENLIDYLKKHYVGVVEVDIEGEEVLLDEKVLKYLTEKNTAQLGFIINDNLELNDVKNYLSWSFESGYNTAARDEIYVSAKSAISGLFGEGNWETYTLKKLTGETTRDKLVYDVTDIFWSTISNHFELCWDDCKRYSDLDTDDDYEIMEYCDDCYEPSYRDFVYMVKEDLWEERELLNPRFSEHPSDEKITEYFIEDSYNWM